MTATATSTSTATVHLRTLHLRGAAGEVAEARARLPTQLAAVAWPGEADDGEVVLVRRVRIEGQPGELAARMAEAVRRLVAQAVAADSPGADSAEAVRFDNRSDCTACLLHDLLTGRAPQRWLWRHRHARLSQPLAEAVTGLLAEDALALPGLLERVRGLGTAPALWRVLDEAPRQVRALLDAVGQVTGWGAAITRACQQAATPPTPPASAIGQGPIPRSMEPRHLAGLESHDPRVVLRAVLALWREAPARLSSPQAAMTLRQCARQHLTLPRGQEATTTTTTVSAPPADWTHSGRPSADVDPRFPEDDGKTASRGQRLIVDTPLEPLVRTRVGGVLLLLNVLNRPDLRTWRTTWDEPQAGWRHLVRLAGALDAAFDPPLAGFLADACGLDRPDDLTRLAHQGTADEVWRLAERQFGHALLRSAVSGGPAWVRCDDPWIDVHFRLADARADLRRTGLDLDPGWLPWLGRVVRFHYDDLP